jgi:hypothetical protein
VDKFRHVVLFFSYSFIAMRKVVIPLSFALAASTNAQSVTPQVLACSGGHGAAGALSIGWTLGETATATLMASGTILTQGFQQPMLVRVRLSAELFLEGPWVPASGNMHDSLRSLGWLPLLEPYTALGYTHVGGGGESTTPAVLAVTGSDAVVDWVFIELRSGSDAQEVIATRSALLQRDGDVVDMDGTSPVSFRASPGGHHVAVHHRNHLAVMTLSPIDLASETTMLDLTDGTTPTYGTDAQTSDGATRMSWAGDVEKDGVLKYTGVDNDRDPILSNIGGVIPTATTAGYLAHDVNMDGTVKYTGLKNDRDPILLNIGGVVPTNTRTEQMP